MTTIERLEPGTSLPPLTMRLTTSVLVAYAGATWDWHRMHHDHQYAAQMGLAGPVVDGQIFGALLAEQCMTAFGPRAWMRSLRFRFRSMVYAGEEVTVVGEVVAVASTPEGTLVSVGHHVAAGDRIAVEPAQSEVIVRG